MLPLNWIDLAIVGLLLLAVWRGLRTNFWSQLFMLAGFFIGLLGVNWIVGTVGRNHLNTTNLSVLKLNFSLMAGAFLAVVGNTLGYRIHTSLTQDKRHRLEHTVSVIFSVFSVLVACWLLAATVGRLPFEGLSNSANDAWIVQTLDDLLPSQPRFLTLLNNYVNPNNLPSVTASKKVIAQTPQQIQVVKTGEDSLVRITSFGCGGVISGSGFVVSSELVLTNAHVIAGVKRPIIKYKNVSLEAKPVYFDAFKDIAVLRVPELHAPSVELATQNQASGENVFVLGYPNGNLRVQTGLISEHLTVYGTSIYDTGLVEQDVYALAVPIEHGSSGGPLLLSDGRVAGMIFAKSDDQKNVGYALTAQSLSFGVLKAITSSKRVGTGVCAS